MDKKPKMKLEDIKVESFITALDEKASYKTPGMGGQTPKTCGTCGEYTCAATCPTCATSPLANCCVD